MNNRFSKFVLLLIGIVVTGWALPLVGHAQSPTVRQAEISTGPAGEEIDLANLAEAFDSQGRGWLVWEQTGTFAGRRDSEILYSRRQGTDWTAPAQLAPDPAAWNHAPTLVIDRQDRVWVAWSRSTGTDDAVWLAQWQDGAWTKPEQVSPPGVVSRFPSLAAGPDGKVWLAWSGFVQNNYELFVRHWDGERWTAPIRLTHDARKGMYDWASRIAVGQDGTPWIAWPRHEANGDDSIFVSHREDGHWTAPERVSTPDGTPDDDVSLAVDPQGRPWLAWIGWDPGAGGGNLVTAHLQDHGWSAEQLPGSSAIASVAHDPAVVVDRQGVPHLAWATGPNLAYSAWNGMAWSEPKRLAASDTSLPAFAALALDGHGQPAFAWVERRDNPRIKWQAGSVDLQELIRPALPARSGMRAATVVGRLLALGDSITYGGYNLPNTYPVLLEARIDNHIYPSEVINEGVPGEWSNEGLDRLKNGLLDTWSPQYLLAMEGTNDITHYTSHTRTRIVISLKSDMEDAKSHSVKGILATIPPRTDDKNDETADVNAGIRSLAAEHHYLLADQWDALTSYPNWQIYVQNNVHPYGPLMQVIADTWYDVFLSLSWINEDTVPPTSSVITLPATTEGTEIYLTWAGSDTGNAGSTNLGTGVSVYDIQVRDGDSGAWTDWQTNTSGVSGTYRGQFNHTYYFRSRAQDRAGNWEAYNGDAADTSTRVTDSLPPSSYVVPLKPFQQGAFQVQWAGSDTVSGIASYDVQYRVGTTGSWQDWQTGTTTTQATFGPTSPVALTTGQTYYFRARARDHAGNVEDYPSGDGDTSTRIAEYGFSGHAYGNRGLPLYGVEITASGGAWNVGVSDYTGYYEVYLPGSGDYTITPTQKYAGPLPALEPFHVSSIITNVDVYMPPLQNDMSNGGLEYGMNGWTVGGVISPVITTTAYSGQGALLLGAGTGAGDSAAGQSPWIPAGQSQPTLSFLYRSTGTGTGQLQVFVVGDTDRVTHTVPLTTTTWTHDWLDLSGLDGQTVAVQFSLQRNDSPDPWRVWIDEVSLGPAMSGPSFLYFPVVMR